jgi:hypothetical protein
MVLNVRTRLATQPAESPLISLALAYWGIVQPRDAAC